MSWLTDLFSVTENSLRRWRERGQLQRLVDVLKEERHKDLHVAALRELSEALAKPSGTTPEGPSRDSIAEILADWSERQPAVTLGPLRAALPGLAAGTRTRIIAKLAATRGGRRWLLENCLDTRCSGELASEILRGIAPRLEDLEAVPRQGLDGQLQARVTELVRSAAAGPDTGKTLRRLLAESHANLRPILLGLAREHMERRLAAATTAEGLAPEELELGLELGRRDKTWIPGLLQRNEQPAPLTGLLLASTRDASDSRFALELLTTLYRKLPQEHASRAELLPRLRELGAPTPLWLELYRGSGPSLRGSLLESLLGSAGFAALGVQPLSELLLEHHEQPPAFARILDALQRSRTEVLETVYETAGAPARQELFQRLSGASGVSLRFHENRFQDEAELIERRRAAVAALLQAGGESGMRQMLERAEPASAAALHRLLFDLALESADPLRQTLLRVIAPLSGEDLRSLLLADGEKAAPEEQRIGLLRQATAGPDGAAILASLLGEIHQEPARSQILKLVRERLEKKVLAPRPALEESDRTQLQDLGRADLPWFKDLLGRCRQPAVLVEPLLEIAWRIPLAEGPVELLKSYYKMDKIGEAERRQVLKALLRHRSGVEVYVELYGDPASAPPARQRKEAPAGAQTLRQRILQILEEHPRASEIPRAFLTGVLLQELADKTSRAGILHIGERRKETSALEEAYALANQRQRQTLYDILLQTPSLSQGFSERLLLDPQEDPRRRLQSALRLGELLGRGGLSRLIEQQDPKVAHELRPWLVERYLNRATPTMEAASLLKALAPAQPQDLEGVLGTDIPSRAFEGRLLELGRSASARPGGVPILVRLLREGDRSLREVAKVLSLEHLEQRARATKDNHFEGEDLELAREVGRLLPEEPPPPEPVVAEPVAVEPIAVEPVAAEPVAAEPVVAEPVAVEPVAAEPVAVEPVAVEPVAAEPVAAEPVAAEPVEAEPVAAEPVAVEPFEPKPSPFEPEPSPFVPEPSPFEPEPSPFVPEPSPFEPEPSPFEPAPQPAPELVPPEPEPFPFVPEPVEPSSEPVEPSPEPVEPSSEPVEPSSEPVEPEVSAELQAPVHAATELVEPEPAPAEPEPEPVPVEPEPVPAEPEPSPVEPRSPDPVAPEPAPVEPESEPVKPIGAEPVESEPIAVLESEPIAVLESGPAAAETAAEPLVSVQEAPKAPVEEEVIFETPVQPPEVPDAVTEPRSMSQALHAPAPAVDVPGPSASETDEGPRFRVT